VFSVRHFNSWTHSGVNHKNIIYVTPEKSAIFPRDNLLDFCLMNSRSINEKTEIIKDYIIEYKSDITAITETWLNGDVTDNKTVGDIKPTGFKFPHIPRIGVKGGGVGLMHRSSLKVHPQKQNVTFESFEYIDLIMNVPGKCFRITVVYRPTPSPENKLTPAMFLRDFQTFLELISSATGESVIIGDFNFHVDDNKDYYAGRFLDLLSSFDLVNHVHEATHIHGHTLDLVITGATSNLVSDFHTTRPNISDHYPIHFKLRCEKPKFERKEISYRKIKSIDIDTFKQQLSDWEPIKNPVSALFESVNDYNEVLGEILDTHAPLITRTVTLRSSAPWFSDEIKKARTLKRKLEQKSRQSQLESDKEDYKEQCQIYNELLLSTKTAHYSKKVEDSCGNQKALFKIVDDLLHRKAEHPLPSRNSDHILANEFADFFVQKIDIIRSGILRKNPNCNVIPRDTAILSHFQEASEDEVRRIIMESPSKWCQLDPIPTSLLKTCVDVLLTLITRIINLSMSSGVMPHNLKESLILPLLKKSLLDPEIFNHFRPVSNLAFLSKIIEKVVSIRYKTHININNLDDPFQSAYKDNHSTETGLVRVHNDILRALDRHEAVILVLLDLSAAFDTVDHKILLNTLSQRFGIKGVALSWFQSYVNDRSERVLINGTTSTSHTPTCGVPQGSVLGPLLFSNYTEPLGEVIRKHGLDYQVYADDNQLYIFFRPRDSDSIQLAKLKIETCIQDVRTWLVDHLLKGNDTKTDMLVISSRYRERPNFPGLTVGDAFIEPSPYVRNLGVIFDDKFTWEREVNTKVRESYFHIKNLGKIRKCLTSEATNTMVHAFVSTKLDYANSLLVALPKLLINKLQCVQNSAARVVAYKRKYDHITPILINLHWLPIHKRIMFKVLLLTYKCLNGVGPKYLQELLVLQESQYSLRSLNQGLLVVPRTHQVTYGDRAFSKAAPILWNSIPYDIRTSSSVDIFKHNLKTYLFRQHFMC
jgi:hypothetical protein